MVKHFISKNNHPASVITQPTKRPWNLRPKTPISYRDLLKQSIKDSCIKQNIVGGHETVTRHISRLVADPAALPRRSTKLQKKHTNSYHFFTHASVASQVSTNETLLKKLGIVNMEVKNYIASPYDKDYLVCVKPVHILEDIQGFGLFAKDFIPAGSCIGEYTGEWVKSTAMSPDYSLVVEDHIVDAKIKGNFTRYINFSDSQSNCEFQPEQDSGQCIGVVRTLKDIDAGQQLLVDYNTFSEEDSRDYYFLNPQDNELTPINWYQQHQKNYTLINDSKLLASGITSTSHCYASPLGQLILQNQSIIEHKENDLTQYVNCPYLPVDSSQLAAKPISHIYSAGEKDIFFPIMLASYLGQVDNVAWLIAHGANVNHQQHHSGNCPLFLALEGYNAARSRIARGNYDKVLVKLIEASANVAIHDRQDNTFLQKAITILSDDHFIETLRIFAINKTHEEVISIFSYINNQTEDLIITCLVNRSWNKLASLLSLYPNYFEHEYAFAKRKKIDLSDQSLLDKLNYVLQSLNDDEKINFFESLRTAKAVWSQSLTMTLLDNGSGNPRELTQNLDSSIENFLSWSI